MQNLTRIIIAFCLLTLSGCLPTEIIAPRHDDPLEGLNREIFKFNLIVDKVIFRPIATVYDTVVPGPVAHGIGNFFDNLDDLTNIANNTLQLKFYDAWSDVWRFAFNTTFGLLGLFDVATCAGLPKHHQDFGLTMAYWGMTSSAYIMVPFFGPTTIRDGLSWIIDWRYLSIWGYIESDTLRYSLYGLRLVHKRACLLPADKLIDDALDPYVFVRDAYIQRREGEINSLYKGKCCQKTSATSTTNDDGDTFVADDDQDSADTFVADDDKDDADTFVADDPKEDKHKSATKQAGHSDPSDPFVAP